jgi:hypothetical protein
MIAYNQNDSLVNKKIVLKSAEHALGNESQYLKSSSGHNLTSNAVLKVTAALSIVAIVSLVALSAFLWGQKTNEQPLPVAIVKSQQTEIKIEDIAPVTEITEKSVEVAPKEMAQGKLIKKDKMNEQLQISGNKPSAKNSVIQKQAIAHHNEMVALKGTEKAKQEPEKIVEQLPINSSLEVTELDEVSDELLTLFQTAVDETASDEKNQKLNNEKSIQSSNLIPDSSTNEKAKVQPLTQMPVWVQNGVPSLMFEQHIYSSDGQGWINVNGRDRYEGDMISSDLKVSKILPQQVILIYRGETFSLPALTNW